MNTTGKDFRVPEGEKINLEKWPTRVEPVYSSKKKYRKLLEKQVEGGITVTLKPGKPGCRICPRA